MESLNGQLIDIAKYQGRPILLSFFRDTNCPFCNLRIHQMIRKMEQWKNSDLVVIGFFTSSREEIERFTGKQNPPFAIIPDPDLVMYDAYGLEKSFLGKLKSLFRFRKMIQAMMAGVFSIRSLPKRNTLPADFLIDENQIITHAYYGKDLADHVPFEEIEKWLRDSVVYQ